MIFWDNEYKRGYLSNIWDVSVIGTLSHAMQCKADEYNLNYAEQMR